VHRDVKPSNILVCANDFACLIEFEIAHASEDLTLTKAGETIGTGAYMAPEAIGAAVKTHSRYPPLGAGSRALAGQGWVCRSQVHTPFFVMAI
jgi:serine/threonine protein kinase